MAANEESYFEQVIGPLRQRPRRSDPDGLDESEEWWIGHFEYLKERGYMMRPRYRPGWQPSYIPGSFGSLYAEDAQRTPHPYVMDALRLSDSLMVALKLVKVSTGEDKLTMLFSDDDHNPDPHNHCVRILEVLPVPGEDAGKILVMVWMRNVIDPRFRTIGEAIQFFKEMIQGLQYMHRNNVAHRHCSLNNMAMEANSMFTRQYHPMAPKKRYDWSGGALHFSRTRRPPRYYLIDFGCSRMYDPSQPRPLEYSLKSGGYIPPEGLADIPCDPFATDVFFLGNLMRTSFLDVLSGFEFLRPLVSDMVADDPSKRPTMDEVASRFTGIVGKLRWWKLRSRAVQKDEFFSTPFRAIYHIFWTASMMLLLKPAIPSPKPLR
ncbi:kinase-like domain-containing protein [Lentinula edodes]|nr:kinase-like domain-containing protein [Lentinula edodes]